MDLAVQVGAILTVPSGIPLARTRPEPSRAGRQDSPTGTVHLKPIALWDLLGKSVLDRVLERFRILGVGEISVIHEQVINPIAEIRHSASKFWAEFETMISRYLQAELETLLLIRVGPYLALDLADFLRFHREIASPMTQAYDQYGALDLVALDAKRLVRGSDCFRRWLLTMIPKRRAYYFKGYANRLSNVADFRRLARDSLLGRTGIRPSGREFCTNVWLGENTRIAKSVRIMPPAYIGERCRVATACIISGASNIEHQCDIDCGTIVDDSCILPGSYVGAGLNVTGGVVCQETFFHLRHDVQLQFHDGRLFGKNLTGWDYLIAQMRLFVP